VSDDYDPRELRDATLVQRAALDNGSGVDPVIAALARELRRTQAQVAGIEDRL
jgi:hypothetical protein